MKNLEVGDRKVHCKNPMMISGHLIMQVKKIQR
jgi:hypothetical protein